MRDITKAPTRIISNQVYNTNKISVYMIQMPHGNGPNVNNTIKWEPIFIWNKK